MYYVNATRRVQALLIIQDIIVTLYTSIIDINLYVKELEVVT